MGDAYPENVIITEVCPRDGFQSLSEFIPTEEKVDIINDLTLCGFKQIEITSFVHPKAIPQLKDASDLLAKVKRDSGVTYRASIALFIPFKLGTKALYVTP